jgi:hypothetical protein
MSWSSNIKAIVDGIEKKNDLILAAANRGLIKGMYQFEANMIKEQLTGRPGLNRVSSTGATSWVVRSSGSKDDMRVTLGTRAWYLAVHNWIDFRGYIYPKAKKALRFNVGGKWVITKKVFIPKRLHIPESFKQDGPAIIRKRIIIECLTAMGKRS